MPAVKPAASLLKAMMVTATITCGAASAAPPASAPLSGGKPAISTPKASNVAVGGYDAVAYFKQGQATPGRAEFATQWRGAEFRFATEANRQAFLGNPEGYAPQYGGYCAWAVSQGYVARGDPHFWKIVGTKLYLNYDDKIQHKWESDIPGHVAQADMNWPQVLK